MSQNIMFSATSNTVSFYDDSTQKVIVTKMEDDPAKFIKVLISLRKGLHPFNDAKITDSAGSPSEMPKIIMRDIPASIEQHSRLKEKWEAVGYEAKTNQEADMMFDAMENFFVRLDKNPSYRSREQLLRFLENNLIPIMTDGRLLTFKKVKEDYFDCHTGRTHEYKVGTSHDMPRREVSDDPNSACAAGLHVGGYGYVSGFWGAKIIAVIVDPEDVVSVPNDCSSGKIRTHKLYVASEFSSEEEMKEVGQTMVAIPVDLGNNVPVEEEFEDTYEDEEDGSSEVEFAPTYFDIEEKGLFPSDEEPSTISVSDFMAPDYVEDDEEFPAFAGVDNDGQEEASLSDEELSEYEDAPLLDSELSVFKKIDQVFAFAGKMIDPNIEEGEVSSKLTNEFKQAIFDYVTDNVSSSRKKVSTEYMQGIRLAETMIG